MGKIQSYIYKTKQNIEGEKLFTVAHKCMKTTSYKHNIDGLACGLLGCTLEASVLIDQWGYALMPY